MLLPAVDLMIIDLTKRLNEINWLHKADLYNPFIESVTVKNKVENPPLSIIIISWKYNDLILQNFESLNKQRHTNFELIFVNNGKADEEFSSILPYVDTYIKLNTNTGAYLARNIGTIFAKSPILLFLEDDGIAEDHLVQAHLDAFNLFEIISLRGVYQPLNKNNKFNKLAKHYYLGSRPFPKYVDLEGNASYKSEAFFSVGGWSDEIQFGHGGLELSLRLSKKYPNKSLQIYSPAPILFHDFAKSEEHLKSKLIKQQKSIKVLREKYSDWDSYTQEYKKLQGQTHQLIFIDNSNANSYRRFYYLYLFEKFTDFFFTPVVYVGRKIKNLLPINIQNSIRDHL